jgi:hypothetical protein
MGEVSGRPPLIIGRVGERGTNSSQKPPVENGEIIEKDSRRASR